MRRLVGRYVQAEHGIAIRSTLGRLIHSLKDPLRLGDDELMQQWARNQIYIGKVSYVDYATAPWSGLNMFWPFVHKRKSFAHEAEVRAVISGTVGGLDPTEDTAPGRLLVVSLETLIEQVSVSPVAEAWLFDLVKRISERYGLPAEVRQSELAAEPLY
jgi:hypothetical protein